MSQHANVNPLAIGVSTGGNTGGNTGTFQAVAALEGLGAVSLVQATGPGVATVQISVANPVPIGTSVNAVAAASSVGTVTRYAPEDHRHVGVVSAGISTGGNTAGTTGLAPGSLLLLGSNGITASQSSDANGATVTFVGAGTVPGPAETVNPVGATSSIGVQSLYALQDHRHIGVVSGGISSDGNTAGTSGLAPGSLQLVGGANVTLSASSNSAGATVSIVGGAGAGGATISSYQNVPFVTNSASLTGSMVHAVAFLMPQNISVSFLRAPISVGINNLFDASSAGGKTGTFQEFYTWSAGIYSMGIGASSKSLHSVASTTNGWTILNAMTISSNSGSGSQAVSGWVEGNSFVSTASRTNTGANPNVGGLILSQMSGPRFVDIGLPVSIQPGAYFLLMGSANSSSIDPGFTNMSQASLQFSHQYGQNQSNAAFVPIINVTNSTASALLGGGSFSQVGGGIPAAFDISLISSAASNFVLGFQLLRSA